MRIKKSIVISILLAANITLLLAGCEEKPKTDQVIEKSKTAAQDAGDAVKDAANKTGKAIEQTGEKVLDGIKKGAQEVGQVATNVAGEVKAGAEKVGDKVKEATK
jgi:hypothetical protein